MRCRSPTRVAQLGASLATSSSMDAIVRRGRSRCAKNFARSARPAGRCRAPPVVSRPTEIERQRASRLGQLVQQREDPKPSVAAIAARALVRRPPPVRLHRDRHRGVDQARSRATTWRPSGSRTSCRTTRRSSSSGDITMAELRALAEKAFGAWQPGTPAPRCARRTRRRRRLAWSSSTSPARRRRSCAWPAIGARAIVARLPGDPGHERRARRACSPAAST